MHNPKNGLKPVSDTIKKKSELLNLLKDLHETDKRLISALAKAIKLGTNGYVAEDEDILKDIENIFFSSSRTPQGIFVNFLAKSWDLEDDLYNHLRKKKIPVEDRQQSLRQLLKIRDKQYIDTFLESTSYRFEI